MVMLSRLLALTSIAFVAVGCGGASATQFEDPGVDSGAPSTFDSASNPDGVGADAISDDAISTTDAELRTDADGLDTAKPPIGDVASCAVPTMTELYPGA